MRRLLTATVLSVAMVGTITSAAQAQNPTACNAGAGLERGASFVVGTAVGTFPCIVRSMGENVVGFTNDLTGKDASMGWKIAVQPLTFIPAIVDGLFSGPLIAARNAWTYSATAPFSAKCFSIGPCD